MYLKVTEEYTGAKKAFWRHAYWVKNTFLWQLHNCTKTTHLTAHVCATTCAYMLQRISESQNDILCQKQHVNILTEAPCEFSVLWTCCKERTQNQTWCLLHSTVTSQQIRIFFGHSRVYYNNIWAAYVPMPLIPTVWGWFQH